MCNDSNLHSFLAALPKCEHHMHLEGSFEPSLLFKLAKKNNVSLPAAEDAAFESEESLLKRYENFANLDDFLHYYFIAMSTLIDESDFEALAWDYFQRAKKDNVMHAEVFFDPQPHSERGIPYVTVFNGFSAACKRAESELGLTNELIVCFMRHLPASEAEELYQTALPDLKAGRVAGIGLSASELGNPPRLFKSVYEAAEKEGIKRTAHAGEEADVSYMKEALSELQVHRMDHGIKLPEDLNFMNEIVRREILITICPLSNIRLRCVTEIAELPIRHYLDAGVQFSLNSDDPAYFGGYILDNYCAVQNAFALSKEDWQTIVTASVKGSWCSNARKEEMMAALQKTLQDHM